CEVPGHAAKGMTGTVIVNGSVGLLNLGSGVNWIAILVMALVPMMVGFLWYSPILFAKKWMAALGIKESEMAGMKKEAPKAYAVSFIGALLTSFILFTVVRWTG